jgi:hypothetical protein
MSNVIDFTIPGPNLSPVDLFKQLLIRCDVKFPDAEKVTVSGISRDQLTVENTLFSMASHIGFNKKGVSKDLIKAQLQLAKVYSIDDAKAQAIAAISFRGNDDDTLIRQAVHIWTGEVDEMDIAVMKHFFRQTKRKLLGLPVDHDLMIALYGNVTDTGKSTAIRKILEPLLTAGLATETNLDCFGESREHYLFVEYPVIFLDEMGGLKKLDEASFKRILTAKKINYRRPGTNTSVIGPMISVFIASVNTPIAELIKDPTCARRLYQMNACEDQFDWDAINKMDVNALWQSVDEKGPCPVSALWKDIRRRQDSEPGRSTR